LLSLLAPRPTSSALFPYTTLFRSIRDRHMVEALSRIKAFHGPHAKAIVWEHNTHIGDARATDMAADGMVNVGQLVREKFGQEQRSEEHTSELQSRENLVCRLLLEK